MFLIQFYVFVTLIDFGMLIITGIRIFQKARHLEHSEQAYFDEERKNFWIYVKLCAMMLITWPAEVLSWPYGYFLELLLAADVLKLLTAVAILGLVLGRKQAQILLFDKYRNFIDTLD